MTTLIAKNKTHTNNTALNGTSLNKHKSAKSILLSTALAASMLIPFSSNALEAGLQVHKGQESGSVGYTLALADQISNKSPFGWQVSYNHISEIGITWNDEDLFFDSNTIEAMATYQYAPKSYNKFLNRLVFEFQAGVALNLTENKFVWEDLNQEKIFSEKNDVSLALAFLTHYKISRKAKVHLGLKYYPKFSEFDGVGSVFMGFTYKFGNQFGY